MELYGAGASVLEIEYFDEVGTGLGPTLEFYSLASQAFAKRELQLWRDEDEHLDGEHVHHPNGLFPRPLAKRSDEADNQGCVLFASSSQVTTETSHSRILHMFKIVGIFVAKALLDSRIIDCNFNKVFMKSVLGQHIDLSLDSLSLVDPAHARSLRSLQEHRVSPAPPVRLSLAVCAWKLPLT